MLVAALALLFLGGGGSLHSAINDSLGISADNVEQVIHDKSQRDQVDESLKDVSNVYSEQEEVLAKMREGFRKASGSHEATRAELQALIDQYVAQDEASQQQWLDAYFKLRGSVTPEQWKQLVADPKADPS